MTVPVALSMCVSAEWSSAASAGAVDVTGPRLQRISQRCDHRQLQPLRERCHLHADRDWCHHLRGWFPGLLWRLQGKSMSAVYGESALTLESQPIITYQEKTLTKTGVTTGS